MEISTYGKRLAEVKMKTFNRKLSSGYNSCLPPGVVDEIPLSRGGDGAAAGSHQAHHHPPLLLLAQRLHGHAGQHFLAALKRVTKVQVL